MLSFETTSSVGDARARFFRESGFPADGGYSARFVALKKLGPIPIVGFPNSNARRRAITMHDLHHVATGYEPNWTGEAEISAWELATGCGRYAFAWFITMQGVAVGLFAAPLRTWRAWVHGRHTRSLYSETFSESLLRQTVGELRAYLGLDRPVPRATLADAISFGFWSVASLVQMGAMLAVPAAAVWLALRALI
jgi:hypothetical protein